MNPTTRHLVALTLFATVAVVAPGVSRAEPPPKAVADYTVFIDPPTGFVFVKLPAGWKFVGRVDPADVARRPAHAVTDLLGDDADRDGAPLASQPKR